MQPEGPQENSIPSPEVKQIETGQSQQAEIEGLGNTFSTASSNLRLELGSIINTNPDIDFSDEQGEITELSSKLTSLSRNIEVDDWFDIGEESVGAEAPKIQFKSKNLGMVQNLIDGGAITGEPSQEPGHVWSRDFSVDPEKARKIMENAEGDEKTEQTTEQEKARLGGEALRIYPEIISFFKEAGVLTDELEVQLGRLLKAENIEVEDISFHHFYYAGEDFPVKPDDEPILRMGTGQLKYMEQRLSDSLGTDNISLEQSQIQEIALIWGLSHEMGHAVDRAMKLRLYEDLKSENPENDFMKEEQQLNDEMEGDVEQVIAPDEGLNTIRNLLRGDEKFRIGGWTHERVAGGFEYVGLGAALTKAGLSREQIDSVVGYLHGLNNEFLAESIKIYEHLRNSGIQDYDLESALYEIKKNFIANRDSDLAAKLPSLRLGSLGYARPLTEEQLEAYITKHTNA